MHKSTKKILRFIHATTRCLLSLLVVSYITSGAVLANDEQSPDLGKVFVSIDVVNGKLVTVLDVIEQQSVFKFSYPDELNSITNISLKVRKESLASVLKKLSSQADVSFKQVNSMIAVGINREENKQSLQKQKNSGSTGTIEGTVYDHETGQGLPGATVTVSHTSLGTVTDADGTFRIKSIPEGLHSLTFSFIGYKGGVVNNIEVKAQTVTKVQYTLLPASTELNEVVISAKVEPENTSERIIVDEIRSSRNIISAISNEQITRSIDFDAAQVLRRASGATLVDNRFIMLRGLDPRYTMTLLNDMITPSSESDRKSFSYDMINSSTIDKVTISKSPAPELPGDFAGGVVKVYTKSYANSRQLQIQLSGQFRPGSSFNEHYTYKGGKYDQLGFDDGSRDRPKGLPLKRNFPNPESTQPQEQYQNAQYARQFSNNWNLKQRFQNIDKRALVNYYNTFNIGKTKLSSLTSLSYWLTGDFRRVQRQVGPILMDTLVEGGRAYIVPPVPGQSTIDSIYSETARLSAMQNFRWNIREGHTIEFRNFFNQLGQDQTLVREYRNSSAGDDVYYEYLRRGVQYNFRSRSLYTSILSGEHSLLKTQPIKLSWRAGYAHTTEKVPDQRRYGVERRDSLSGFSKYFPSLVPLYASTPSFRPGYYRWTASDGGATTDARVYTSLAESAYTASIDAERQFQSITIKTGWFSDYRERTYNTKVYSIYVNNAADLAEDLRPYRVPEYGGLPNIDRNAEEIFNPRNFRHDGSGWDFSDDSGFGRSPDYTASNNQIAGYVALNVPLLDKRFNLYGGVRAEWNRLKSSGTPYLYSRDIGGGEIIAYDTIPTNTEAQLYWLPSVNISYRLVPQFLVRVAYGKTVNRPEFREVGPVMYYDFEKAAYQVGNIHLTSAEIHNLDVRFEWYPKEDELVSAGVFYKDLNNPIESVSSAVSNFANDVIVFLNTNRAEVYGVELEVRKRLDFIRSPVFKSISIIANAAILKSKVEFSDSVRFFDDTFKQRPLQGSAPFTINAGIYYDNKNIGTQVSALYNIIGKRLTAAATAFTSYSLYELPRHVIDLTFSQKLNEFLQIKVGVQDVLNQPYRFYRDVIPDTRFRPNELSKGGKVGGGGEINRWTSDYLEESYRPGSYYSLGVLITF